MTTETKFNNLRGLLILENLNNLEHNLNILNMNDDEIIKHGNYKYHKDKQGVLNWVVSNILNKRTSFKGEYEQQKLKTISSLKKHYEKRLNTELEHLNEIENAQPLPNPIIITIEWKKNKTWGSNPTASDNYGFTSGSIGGCGYDKLSTAVAIVLNQHKYLIQLMCALEEQRLKDVSNSPLSEEDKQKYLSRRSVTGYGSGYGIIPRFEGGVGVSCHASILEKIGYNMQHLSNTANTDVFFITKKEAV